MEPVNARISKEWRRRMLSLLLLISAIAAWFLLDGYVIWPNEAERYEAYSELREKMSAAGTLVDEESVDLRLEWQRYADEAGISPKVPKERTDSAIREQLIIGWSLALICFLFATWIALNHRLSIRTEGDTVIGASGQRVELDSIIGMDRKKWNSKGIAYAIYEADGKQKRLCLDDHKFLGAEAIVLEAERRIDARAKGSVQS